MVTGEHQSAGSRSWEVGGRIGGQQKANRWGKAWECVQSLGVTWGKVG